MVLYITVCIKYYRNIYYALDDDQLETIFLLVGNNQPIGIYLQAYRPVLLD